MSREALNDDYILSFRTRSGIQEDFFRIVFWILGLWLAFLLDLICDSSSSPRMTKKRIMTACSGQNRTFLL